MTIQNLAFDDFTVRMEMRNDEPWFVLADVCRVLEIGNPSDAARRLDDDEKHTLDNVEGIAAKQVQSITIINESGLYSLILTSRKPEAKRFKKWVTSEVLPTLRRTGMYVAGRTMEDENLPQLSDGVLFGMRVGKVNAAARAIGVANQIAGPQAARELWRRSGLPEIDSKAISTLAGTPEDDPAGCLRHMLRTAIGNGATFKDHLALAAHDKMIGLSLRALGVAVNPTEAPGWVAIANSHPYLREIYAHTQWADNWRIAFALMPSAKPSKDEIGFGKTRSRAVLISRHDLLNAIYPVSAGH